ncbi:MAG: SH3 domain-containing protein, partial [Acidobacteriota bacterium]
VRVTAGTLNVRSGPSTKDAVVTKVRRGQALTVLDSRDAWLEVKAPGGQVGWVHSKYTAADQPCLPDKETAEVLSAPPLSFSELSARGTVRVEAEVNADGTVEKTTVAANTTGSEDAALLAEAEVRQMKFAPPVRRCRPVRFIYVYTRTF